MFGIFNVYNAPQWLGGTSLTLPSIAIMEVWWGLGYHTIFFLAGLAAIPKDLPEAARLDGANEWQIFWHVTRPGLQPIMMILVVLRFGSAMAVIDEYLIFGGFNRNSPTYTWTMFMYDQAFKLGTVAARLRGCDRHDRRGGHDGRRGRASSTFSGARAERAWRGRATVERRIDPVAVALARRAGGAAPTGAHPPCRDRLFMRDHPAAAGLGALDVDQVAARRDAGRDSGRAHFDFTHYGYVFQKIDTLPVNLFNSIYVTAGTVLITTACAVLAGYALVHLRPRGGVFIVAMLLASLYFPIRVVSLISVYEIQNFLGLINSTSGLILPYVTLNLAISVLIMRSVFQLVPHELIEAAKIDGGGPWRTLWLIGIPMARNGLVVVFIVNFVTAWGEFLLCTTLTNDQTARTMPVVLAAAQGGLGQWAWPRARRRLRHRRHPWHPRLHLRQRLFFKGLTEGVLKASMHTAKPVTDDRGGLDRVGLFVYAKGIHQAIRVPMHDYRQAVRQWPQPSRAPAARVPLRRRRGQNSPVRPGRAARARGDGCRRVVRGSGPLRGAVHARRARSAGDAEPARLRVTTPARHQRLHRGYIDEQAAGRAASPPLGADPG